MCQCVPDKQTRQRNARPKPRTTDSQVLNVEVTVVSEVVIKRTQSLNKVCLLQLYGAVGASAGSLV